MTDVKESTEHKLDFHGDVIIIDDAALKSKKPNRPHLAILDPRVGRYVYVLIRDVKIDYHGKRIGYSQFLRKAGSPLVY